MSDMVQRPPSIKIKGYELLTVLGSGGMGSVHLANCLKGGEQVAIKVMKEEHRSNERAVRRFRREARALMQVEHNNIVRALEVGEQDGVLYVVMELVRGTPFDQLIDIHGPLAIEDACDLIQQAARGLHAAHKKGMVHRDIKSSNLLLSFRGEVKLVDLGLALLKNENPYGSLVSLDGQILGTPDFMAPEQCRNSHEVDIRADIYSLGCTLYHLLSGRPPFDHPRYSSVMDKMWGHMKHPVPPIQEIRPDLPDDLANMIRRLLAKNPLRRPATPLRLARMLKRYAVDGDAQRLINHVLTGMSVGPEHPTPLPATLSTREAEILRDQFRKQQEKDGGETQDAVEH